MTQAKNEKPTAKSKAVGAVPAAKPQAAASAPAAKPQAAASAPAAKPDASVPKDHQLHRAADFMDKDIPTIQAAADDGNMHAMRALGNRYKTGNGVAQDFAQMQKWWQAAANAGDPEATWDLGYYQLIGKYLPQNTDEALKWYQLSVDAGNADAAFELGVFYENGQFVRQDFTAARKWLQLAGKLGKKRAAAELKHLEKGETAHKRLEERRGQTDANGVMPDIVLTGVTQRFGSKTVLDDITLRVKSGELIAIVGGSGSGKSTLVDIMRGELKPTRGTVQFDGAYGLVPQQNLVHESLTVQQHLAYYASAVKRLPRAQQEGEIARVMDELDLAHAKDSLVGKCSGGEQRRVSVACELLARPDTLLLDEPTSGLDPGDSGDLIDVLHGLVLNSNMTVMVVNHDYENIRLFDKVVFLGKGKICFYGTPDALFSYFDTQSAREIYALMRVNPDPFIRRFEEWRLSNPSVEGGIQ
jgi:iron(III) transport system ATP-binding protein